MEVGAVVGYRGLVKEILDEKNAAAKKKELDELINWLLGGGIVVMVLGFIVWWLTLLMEKH